MMKASNNFVAKHCNEYNKPATHIDRKKQKKKGHEKHKKQLAKQIESE